MSQEFWRAKRVFVTGHTGFKGGWLSMWLTQLGADVYGYALPPPTEPSFFEATGLRERLTRSTFGDIRDTASLSEAMRSAQPDIVLHLAAQPLVRYSYTAPVETYDVNVMGLVNVFEAVRQTPGVRSVVNVTTDKCYENREWLWAYRENESLGGYDPYSSSKACAEIVTAAYRRSFMQAAGIPLGSARAGNVIGGGDWAADRLIPDFLRSIDASRTLVIRSPGAVRPWQHVLEPLSGYLTLAQRLYEAGDAFAQAWNFGPDDADAKPVQWIVEQLCAQVPSASWQLEGVPQPHEANTLKLDSTKAKSLLGWAPRWNLETALRKTLDWHMAWRQGASMTDVSLKQIEQYEAGTRE